MGGTLRTAQVGLRLCPLLGTNDCRCCCACRAPSLHADGQPRGLQRGQMQPPRPSGNNSPNRFRLTCKCSLLDDVRGQLHPRPYSASHAATPCASVLHSAGRACRRGMRVKQVSTPRAIRFGSSDIVQLWRPRTNGLADISDIVLTTCGLSHQSAGSYVTTLQWCADGPDVSPYRQGNRHVYRTGM